MAAVLASVIAVLGTLAGATVGYIFQRRGSQLDQVSAREERLRQEQLTACSAFAAAVMELRRAQYDRWYRRREPPDQLDSGHARDESYRLRSAAWSAFYRFRLTTRDTDLTSLGWTAVEEAAHISTAAIEAELRANGERARDLLDQFVAAAAAQFTDGPRHCGAPRVSRPGLRSRSLTGKCAQVISGRKRSGSA
jgi:hypothetical protein